MLNRSEALWPCQRHAERIAPLLLTQTGLPHAQRQSICLVHPPTATAADRLPATAAGHINRQLPLRVAVPDIGYCSSHTPHKLSANTSNKQLHNSSNHSRHISTVASCSAQVSSLSSTNLLITMADTAAANAANAAPGAPAQADSTKLAGNAAAAVHSVLGTAMPLSQISKVKMHISGKCKMGISFWPMFSFNPPERDEKPGTVKLVNAAEVPANTKATAAAGSSGSIRERNFCCWQQPLSGSSNGSSAGADRSDSGGSTNGASPPAEAVGSISHESASQLLHVNFTQDPPDEFSVGAKFLGGIPFPFLSIKTTRLEGTIDPATGAVVLLFEAQFLAQMGSKEPTVLPINASLTSEPAAAYNVRLEGQRLTDGRVTLVSAAEVPKTNSWLANLILWLPTAATAVLPMRLEFLQG